MLLHTAHQCAKRDKMTSVTKRSYSMCYILLLLLIKHISVPASQSGKTADTKAKATIRVVWPLWFNALISVLAYELQCTHRLSELEHGAHVWARARARHSSSLVKHE